MRYNTSHKEQTHQRIIDVASRLFKEQGIDATGVAAVMSEAKLTNGAFYAHFESKEALVEEVIAQQIQEQIKTFQEAPKDISGVKAIIATYLTPEHRDNCGAGCPSAALLEEIGRRSLTTKDAYSKGMLELVDSFQEHFSHLDTKQTRTLVFGLVSLLIGTLQLARAMDDQELSNQILESGRIAAAAILNTAKP